MKGSKERLLRSRVELFVAHQNGRFREHCSDRFLTEVLLLRLRERSGGGRRIRGDMVLEGDRNPAYAAAVAVFEWILEVECCVPVNGHHVAQEFADKVTSQPSISDDQKEP